MLSNHNKTSHNGFTLIEIIASIAIVGIVIAVFLPVFPQIIGWSNQVEDELSASNLLGQIAYDMKEADIIQEVKIDITDCPGYLSNDRHFGYYDLNQQTYEATFNICKEKNIDLYRTHIKVLTPEGKVASESYTYIDAGDSGG